MERPRIAVTMGDPNGIGPEVVLKTLTDSRILKYIDPIVVGSVAVLRHYAGLVPVRPDLIRETTDLDADVPPPGGLRVVDVFNGQAPAMRVGETTEEGGRAAMVSVERAVELCLAGRVEAMVTAPLSKEAIAMAGYTNRGHTEFIAQKTGVGGHTMMMVSEQLRVALVTEHVPLWEVPAMVTVEAIKEKIRLTTSSLARDFGVERPRIAVLGLNPHAGDGGLLGSEEIATILPAIEAACAEGLHAFGPFPADGFFAVGMYRNYDAVLAMYHDQGLIPFKTLAFSTGVNYTAGLPIIRTSPDHGTAFNIAGTGRADPGSMRSALFLALDVVRRRRRSLNLA
jgi:4-hydroxythreonine-4-phosphate dehydrogenase